MWVKSGSQPKHTLSFRINLTRISIWKYNSTQIFPVLSLNKWNHFEMGCNTLNNICEQNNVSKIKHLTYKSHEKMLNQERTSSLMKGCQKEFIPYFLFSHINIWTTWVKVNNKKCFLDLLECQLFFEFPFNIFFFNSSSSKQYSFLKFHFSKIDENPFYFLLFDTFPFFFSLNSLFLSFFFNSCTNHHIETNWSNSILKHYG